MARGGMGVVLMARDREIRREIAMKVMLSSDDESRRVRFVEEALVTGQLEHPNIVPVHELGVDSGGLAKGLVQFPQAFAGGGVGVHGRLIPLERPLRAVKGEPV